MASFKPPAGYPRGLRPQPPPFARALPGSTPKGDPKTTLPPPPFAGARAAPMNPGSLGKPRPG